ncbi:YcaO-like family protein [Natranaeroarchaeum aerophilus]|uniref:YcaO-like family protein n=1 Tax=Natranaeroarchaeum aerophilus TaxID=2917711 RepID=A0AAE3K4N0_9EURY|nr:YcaO-like family protein [Natranaeroarchaeum aerophilus]MCL9813388.1 YcaO-like family protein [Natranaeroarchaeum aerophilus]
MDVTLVGDGPAIDALTETLHDASVSTRTADAEEIGTAEFAVVTDLAGAQTFDRANRAAREGGTPWLAIEVGGIGGRAIGDIDAAISGFAPATGCYDCLRSRVDADRDSDGASSEPRAGRSAVRLAGSVAGHELVQLLSGEETPVLGGVIEIPHHRRQFLPVPGCECGSAPAADLDLAYEPSPVEAALERAEMALDDRVGIVESVGEIESFPAPYYLANVRATSGFSDADAPAQAAGVHPDWNTAFMKALGEALERYGAAIYRDEEFQHGRTDDIENPITPDRFVLPDDTDADLDGPIPWRSGLDIDTGETVSVPAEKAHFPPPTRELGAAITTGLGLGSSTVGALLSGLYEVIERDATMLAWYSTFEPLALAVDDEAFQSLARRARSEELTVTPLLVTQDVDIPVIAVAVHRDGEWPRFAVGSAAALDPTDAARDALAEALQNWMELRSMGRETASEESGAIGEYASFPEEAAIFVDAGNPIPVDSVGPDDVPEGEAELDMLVERVVDAGLSPYGVRLTPRDLETIGFEVVRAVVPEAQPLFTREPFFGERARTVPGDLGFEPRLERRFHPYP